jgi:hypothetical protein
MKALVDEYGAAVAARVAALVGLGAGAALEAAKVREVEARHALDEAIARLTPQEFEDLLAGSTNLAGKVATLNGHGDLMVEKLTYGPYIGTLVNVVKRCKSGLWYVETHDGKFLSVPQRNLDIE